MKRVILAVMYASKETAIKPEKKMRGFRQDCLHHCEENSLHLSSFPQFTYMIYLISIVISYSCYGSFEFLVILLFFPEILRD